MRAVLARPSEGRVSLRPRWKRSGDPTDYGASPGRRGQDQLSEQLDNDHPTPHVRRPLLGRILGEKFNLLDSKLEEALAYQQEKGGLLGEVLLHLRLLREEHVLEALAHQFEIAWMPQLETTHVDHELIKKVPIAFCRRYRVLPLRYEEGAILTASTDPLETVALDDLRLLLGKPIKPVLTTSVVLLACLNRAYDEIANPAGAEQVMEDIAANQSLDQLAHELDEPQDLLDATDEAPIIRLVNSVLFQAVRQRASDIHFESFERGLVVRYRIDGVLYPVLTPPKHLQASIIARLKIMAGLNIAEKRLPQDGRFAIRTSGKDVDLRVSVLPTSHGERVVLRLLEKENRLLNLSEMGFSKDRLAVIHQLIQLAHGIILVTGPTGSGKTTTLYAALSHINAPDKNIITVEDPVEYQLLGIGQMQVNPKINLSFAAGLRSILRQDPDVIMIGEIRDRETAEIAIHASLTGHLVFSTLHTNDAASAATRLIDMGIEPFLVASSVVAVLAQRLLRRICPDCKRPYAPSEDELSRLDVAPGSDVTLYRGAGCAACSQTGYRGRTGIFELMVLNDEIRRLIGGKADSTAIKHAALANGMVTLKQEGTERVLQGQTTLEEVMRITQQEIDV
ncbi:type II secretion system ATPase GspE [Candidatus Nitrospira nitrificans]|uniref:protein-secreting ATPase n=1 Tax=Candidatus Nitrospira nitrificans TaxID=1742973 RepID=A0A0S4L1F2_9BACT|nr:type II secretion system ATPase GspE [Candidatus Nitrospira nitrificans]CUS31441.1 General secretion pathway protein F [Candidatus Nitrospira nitrificans]